MSQSRIKKRRKINRRVAVRRKTILVEDWRKAYKWASVQIAAVIAAAQGLIIFVPTVKDYLPDNVLHTIMAILAIAVILARIKNQKPVMEKNN